MHAGLKEMLLKAVPEDKYTFPIIFWSGVVSGAVAAAAVTPADVVKTRLQASADKQGVYQCFRQVLQNEGGRALFKGAGWRVAIMSVRQVMLICSRCFPLLY